MSMLEQVVGGIVTWGVIAAVCGSLIWALINLRRPNRNLRHLNSAGNMPESRIIEMQPKRRIIEVPVVHAGTGKGIAAISGIR